MLTTKVIQFESYRPDTQTHSRLTALHSR